MWRIQDHGPGPRAENLSQFILAPFPFRRVKFEKASSAARDGDSSAEAFVIGIEDDNLVTWLNERSEDCIESLRGACGDGDLSLWVGFMQPCGLRT
ncbi:hypothetical protein ADL15_07760 [Actinoplanes awajinensis subsp. mycoplanecinus]|uniref:Uncharacterized protein n=1 Tax=Actinoplanes awajinensis subsp. mycoplanecinus TaxID=135947 RepID=A0A0X3V5R1_9ACTN|nr:hypothetical protein ADL15_07760 [Actinoplanes awajinensis subsp. mycoplanecinus]